MSNLFSLLGVAARALDAQRFGLDATGQNIANVNTPGYARRSVEMAEVPPPDPRSAGGGVDVIAVRAARAPLIEARLRQQQPAVSREGTIADRLAVVEADLGTPGASLDAALAAFYNTYAALAQAPTSFTARQQVVAEGRALATSFNELAARFAANQHDADVELGDTVERVNALARQIAQLNDAIVSSQPESVETLRDQQSVALSSLADLADVNVLRRQDGGVDVSIGNGRALVVGANVYDLATSPAGAQGFLSIFSTGASVLTDVTGEITGGRIGGLIQVRDILLPGYASRLDQLAYSVAGDVNALHTGGFDLTGAAGTSFFVPAAGVAGAARLMAVDSAVAADSRLVVAASAPSPGNNDVARQIAALQDAPMSGGTATPVDAWGDLVYRVADDSRTASQAQTSHQQVAQQLETLRDQISGVSLDEEAAMLMRFQRAYEANARFFRAADQMLDVLMGMVGV